jgi:hypothetical protein
LVIGTIPGPLLEGWVIDNACLIFVEGSCGNKGNYCLPPLRNSINDQNIDDIAYDDSDKCELLKYADFFSLLNHGLSFSRINIVFEGIHALEI